jgi:hypothetical protein
MREHVPGSTPNEDEPRGDGHDPGRCDDGSLAGLSVRIDFEYSSRAAEHIEPA